MQKVHTNGKRITSLFMAFTLILGLVAVFFSPVAVAAAGNMDEVYLHTGGNDTNDGTTLANAVKTFTKAKTLLASNGTIYLSILSNIQGVTTAAPNIVCEEEYGLIKMVLLDEKLPDARVYAIQVSNNVNSVIENITLDFSQVTPENLNKFADIFRFAGNGSLTIGENTIVILPDGTSLIQPPPKTGTQTLTISENAIIKYSNGDAANITRPDGEYASLTVIDNRTSGGGEADPGDISDGITAGNDTAGTVDYAWGYGGAITEESSGSFTITAFDDTTKHYVIDTVVVDGVAQTVTSGAKTMTIDNVSESVFVTFAYTVNFLDPTYGTLSVSRGVNSLTSGDIVRGGDVLTITVEPNSGYALDGALKLVGLTRDGATDNYIVTAENGADTPSVSATLVATVKTAAPTFAPSAGAVASGSTVTISAETGATVYYTTNGATPTTSSAVYTAPIAITSATTIKAIAVKAGQVDSDVATAAYTIATAQAPIITTQPSAGINDTSNGFYLIDASVGDTVTLSIEVAAVTDGGTLSYQWKTGSTLTSNVPAASGGESTSITINPANAGTFYYRCDVTNTTGGSSATTYSHAIRLTVAADPNTKYNVTTSGSGYTYTIVNNATGATLTEQTPKTHSQFAKAGDSVTVIATPNEGYGISSIGTAGVTGSNGSVTFKMPAGNATVSVSTTTEKTVTVVQTENGTLTAPITPGFSGGTVAFTATPEPGYRVNKVEMSTDQTNWTTVFGNSINVSATGPATVYLRATFVAGGDLTISNEGELRAFATNVNAGDSHRGVTVTLADDIALSGQWIPIGTAENPFAGTFDGGGKTVSGLSISYVHGNENYYLGLFGYAYGGGIRNLTVDGDITVSTSLDYNNQGTLGGINTIYGTVGSVIAYVNGATIENCTSNVDITVAYAQLGGVIGTAVRSTLTNCMNYGTLTNTKRNQSVGGIVGNAIDGTTFTNCGNYGMIYLCAEKMLVQDDLAGNSLMELTTGSAGGVVGTLAGGSVNNCFNKGEIVGWGQYIGGIAGRIGVSGFVNDVAITNSYNTGAITQTALQNRNVPQYAYVAGISGFNVNDALQLTIANCYNAGVLTNTARESHNKTNALYDKTNGSVTDSNNYAYGTTPTAAQLGTAYKDDTGLNGGFPLLDWENDAVSDTTYAVTFNTTPASATVTVYSDAGRTAAIANASSLQAGTYYYKVEAANYLTKEGSFTVTNRAVTQTIALDKLAVVKITVLPAGIGATVTINGETPISSVGGVFTYNLTEGLQYTASIAASGYNGAVKEFIANSNAPISVTLTASEHSSNAGDNNTVYGSGNASKESTITTSGTYYIGEGATGILTINASNVTLVGLGTTKSYDNLYINCTNPSTSLTLKDVFISVYDANAQTKGNLINFPAGNHTLTMSGTSVLDMDSNASGFATIHAPTGTSLNIDGSGYLYIYKSEQGAAIGGNGGATGADGQPAEANGTITISDGNLFIKGSKQGALIGAGSGAASVGDITINGGNIYLIAVARGAAIGGAAGSNGGTPGGTVRINGGTLSISVDYSGAAIGGGGYDGGNDKPGGTLVYTGGSIRTFVNENARSQWANTNQGVNDKPITATKVDGSGNALYLFALDTSKYSSGNLSVVADGKAISHGGLHTYRYVNEDSQKTSQMQVQYTMNNWEYDNDPNLYLYLQGKDQMVTVGSGSTTTSINLKWNAQTEKFTVEGSTDDNKADTGNGNGFNGGTVVDNSEIRAEYGEDKVPLSDAPDQLVTIESNTTTSNGETTSKVTEAEIKTAVESAKDDDKLGIAIAPKNAGSDVTKLIVELPTASVETIADADLSLVINTPIGNLTFEGDAVAAIVSGAGSGETVQIIVEAVDESKLGDAQKDAIGDRPAFDLTVKSGNTVISSFGAGRVIVTIPYTLKQGESPEGLRVFHVAADGTRTEIACTYNRNISSIIFVVNHFSVYVIDYDASAVWTNPFTDVKESDWFYDAVKFVSSQGLMNGTGADKFAPSANLTRAMLVTILYRAEGEPTVTGNGGFTDVPSGQWYSNAIAWAAENGIVNGVGDDKFSPNGNITREQLATILHRYAAFKGETAPANGDLSVYLDGAKTSSWAADAMKWAVGTGLINGTSATTVDPQGTATRAQVATILMRYIKK